MSKKQSPPKTETVLLFADAMPATQDNHVTGFSGVPYAGGVVPNFGWHGDIAIDLSSLTLPRTDVPVLLNHDPDKIVGRAAVTNDGQRIAIDRGAFSSVTNAAKEVSALLAEGHPWQLSVGVSARAKAIDRAKPVTVNGRSVTIDTLFQDARLLEFSFVPAGADPNAYAARLSARIGATPTENPTMPNERDDAALASQLQTAQARITELETTLATLTAERDGLRTRLQAVAIEARNAEIIALFGKDHKLPDPTIAAYRAMTTEQFAAMRDAVETARRQSDDPNLFRHVSTSGVNPDRPTAGAGSFAAPVGFTVDNERAALHAKAVQYAAEHKCDYLAAVAAVAH